MSNFTNHSTFFVHFVFVCSFFLSWRELGLVIIYLTGFCCLMNKNHFVKKIITLVNITLYNNHSWKKNFFTTASLWTSPLDMSGQAWTRSRQVTAHQRQKNIAPQRISVTFWDEVNIKANNNWFDYSKDQRPNWMKAD